MLLSAAEAVAANKESFTIGRSLEIKPTPTRVADATPRTSQRCSLEEIIFTYSELARF
jgi:hypothetical protein